jgi:hypothetical protein
LPIIGVTLADSYPATKTVKKRPFFGKNNTLLSITT